MEIKIPKEAEYIICTLESNGHTAFTVGGCVRDSLLGLEPKDWDICTSAFPEQIIDCFLEHRVIESGFRHGTVTLILNNRPFEITTFRVDGVYSDGRRPDKVEFVKNLTDDLSRRDFTINSMAYNPNEGVVDLHNGKSDLYSGIIRCVGNATERFQEDALRIMRALRFASILGFSIDFDTARAMHEKKSLLKNIAVERVSKELNGLLAGNGVDNTLLEHISIIIEIIPELKPMIGFRQNNPFHHLDVMEHTISGIRYAPSDIVLRLAMLFHDIAKPECYTEKYGVGHFYGHAKAGYEKAKNILTRMKYDNRTITQVTELVYYHDMAIRPYESNIKRWLNKIGEGSFRRLLEIKKADIRAKAFMYQKNRLAELDEILILLNVITQQRQCFSLRDLAINGGDLIASGIPEGVKIGIILRHLTDKVIDGEIENDRDALLKSAKEIM